MAFSPPESHFVLIRGSFFYSLILKYLVFISTVAICIYMFNKRRYDLLRAVVVMVLTAESVRATRLEMLDGCGRSKKAKWARVLQL